MKRNSFLLYTDSLEIISELSDAQAGRLLRAIVLYQKHVHDENNTEYEEFLTDSLVRVCFSQIRSSIDRDNEKYREVCRKRADAGRKGGISKRDSHKKESLSPVLPLSDISSSLMGDELWKEQMCRQSGIGAGNFLIIIGEQISKFLDYITATGQEKSVLTVDDAKRRFFWWWKNQGMEEYNGRNKPSYRKPDIQSGKPDEKRYSGKF